MRGKKPKPTALKVLQGNPGKRPLPKNEPVAGGVPTCPSRLSEEAKAAWQRTLEIAHWITEADREVLVTFCEAIAESAEAEAMLRRKGRVLNGKQSPWIFIKDKAEARKHGAGGHLQTAQE